MFVNIALAYCAIQVVTAPKHSLLNQSAPWISHLKLLPFLGESRMTHIQNLE